MGLSRNEEILENILGDEDPIPEPVSRIEALLIRIHDQLKAHDELTATYNDGTVTLEMR